MNWRDILWSAVIVTGAILLGLLVHRISFAVGRRIMGRTANRIDQSFVRHADAPARLILPLLVSLLVLPALRLPKALLAPFRHLLTLALIAAVAWFAAGLVNVADDFVAQRGWARGWHGSPADAVEPPCGRADRPY